MNKAIQMGIQFICYNFYMQEKNEAKTLVHSIMWRNGFYQLSLQKLQDILRLIDMPVSDSNSEIQDCAISGFIKVVEKYKDKLNERLSLPQYSAYSQNIKEYVALISRQIYFSLNKNNSNGYVNGYAMPMNPQHLNPYAMGQMNLAALNSPYFRYPAVNSAMMGVPSPMSTLGIPQMQMPNMPGMSMANPPQISESLKNLYEERMRMYYYMNMMNPMYSQAIQSYLPHNFNNQPQISKKVNPVPPEPIKKVNIIPEQVKKPILLASSQPLKKLVALPNPAVIDLEKTSTSNPPGKPLLRAQRERKTEESKKSKQEKKVLPKNYLAVANPAFSACVCKGFFVYDEEFTCSQCKKRQHFYCLSESVRKLDKKQLIMCYLCKLKAVDPLNVVRQILGQFYITNLSQSRFTFQVNCKPFEEICKKNKHDIEIRCMKVISTADFPEITWPDDCIIKLNGERIFQIPALQLNSSLKKRKDYSIDITSNLFQKESASSLDQTKLSLEIKSLTLDERMMKKIKNDYTFAVGLYLTEKLTSDELFYKIVEKENILERPDYIQEIMRIDQNEIQINRIVITLLDPYTRDLIKTPVRGIKCLHGQCFDLKVFISFMLCAKIRNWKCPICSKDARSFMIAQQQVEVLKRIAETNLIPLEVALLKNGKIQLKLDEDSGNDDQVDRRPEKSKRISKEVKEVKQAKKQHEDPNNQYSPELNGKQRHSNSKKKEATSYS